MSTLWKEEELIFLDNNYISLGASKCAEVLKKSPNSIRKQASRRFLTNVDNVWTDEELKTLQTEYEKLGSVKLSKLINRSPFAIKKKASQLNIKGKSSGGYSQMAISWLNSLKNPNILHAENGGEQFIAGYYVDGYDPYTNSVYEFHGDRFHGNLDLFSPNDTPNPFDRRKTAEYLWSKTYYRMVDLSQKAVVYYIWEKDYLEGKSFERF